MPPWPSTTTCCGAFPEFVAVTFIGLKGHSTLLNTYFPDPIPSYLIHNATIYFNIFAHHGPSSGLCLDLVSMETDTKTKWKQVAYYIWTTLCSQGDNFPNFQLHRFFTKLKMLKCLPVTENQQARFMSKHNKTQLRRLLFRLTKIVFPCIVL